jgi:hypothetical protein
MTVVHRAHLAGGVRLVVVWLEILHLLFLAVVLFDLAFGHVLATCRQHAPGPLPQQLFLAVLGRYRHQGSLAAGERRHITFTISRSRGDLPAQRQPDLAARPA